MYFCRTPLRFLFISSIREAIGRAWHTRDGCCCPGAKSWLFCHFVSWPLLVSSGWTSQKTRELSVEVSCILVSHGSWFWWKSLLHQPERHVHRGTVTRSIFSDLDLTIFSTDGWIWGKIHRIRVSCNFWQHFWEDRISMIAVCWTKHGLETDQICKMYCYVGWALCIYSTWISMVIYWGFVTYLSKFRQVHTSSHTWDKPFWWGPLRSL